MFAYVFIQILYAKMVRSPKLVENFLKNKAVLKPLSQELCDQRPEEMRREWVARANFTPEQFATYERTTSPTRRLPIHGALVG